MEESQSQRPARRCITAADKAYALVCCPSMSPNTIEQNICFFRCSHMAFLAFSARLHHMQNMQKKRTDTDHDATQDMKDWNVRICAHVTRQI